MKIRWFQSLLLGCLTLAIIALTFVSYNVYRFLGKPLVSITSQPVVFEVSKDSSAAKFVSTLKAKRLIHSDRYLLLLIRLQGLSNQLKAGIYEIKPGESALKLVQRVASGDVLVKSFRIVEGSTLSQVMDNLKTAEFLNYDPRDLEAIRGDYGSAEGLLLADTYYYNAGSPAKPLLLLANQKLEQFLKTCWENRSSGLPYKSPYQLLIAASIIEKETALPLERKIIAGVIVNRLKKYMPLQMDPTVIYALGKNYHGKLVHEDLNIDSPYNTYRNRGLPKTPIAMVSKASIEAAARPMKTDYLYFVAKGDGSHYFSATYDEQRRAINRYQKGGSE